MTAQQLVGRVPSPPPLAQSDQPCSSSGGSPQTPVSRSRGTVESTFRSRQRGGSKVWSFAYASYACFGLALFSGSAQKCRFEVYVVVLMSGSQQLSSNSNSR